MQRKNILVTGGAGFIGSHVADALIGQGHKVTIVDNLCTGSISNINPKARFYQLSICDRGLERVFEQEKPQVVIHKAAQTVVARSEADPAFDAEQNILGSLNVILNCLKFGVIKIVYASSAAVYGDPGYNPVDEKHPLNPLSAYGISKHTIEHYLQLYGTQYGLNYVALRYSNVYGPRQNPKSEAGVVAIFASQMLKGERPTIYGTGDKTRDYIHVSDVVAANLRSIEVNVNSIYNISTGIETSDQEIFNRLAGILGYEDAPKYAPVRKGEIYRICLECLKAKDGLDWRPRIALAEGLSTTVTFYRSLLK